MYLAKTAPYAVVRFLNKRNAVFVDAYNIFRAECAADPTGLAPVSKNNLIV